MCTIQRTLLSPRALYLIPPQRRFPLIHDAPNVQTLPYSCPYGTPGPGLPPPSGSCYLSPHMSDPKWDVHCKAVKIHEEMSGTLHTTKSPSSSIPSHHERQPKRCLLDSRNQSERRSCEVQRTPRVVLVDWNADKETEETPSPNFCVLMDLFVGIAGARGAIL
ncbi:hypothetical protein VTO73DRAFT_8517 [Trametes versicolor]